MAGRNRSYRTRFQRCNKTACFAGSRVQPGAGLVVRSASGRLGGLRYLRRKCYSKVIYFATSLHRQESGYISCDDRVNIMVTPARKRAFLGTSSTDLSEICPKGTISYGKASRHEKPGLSCCRTCHFAVAESRFIRLVFSIRE